MKQIGFASLIGFSLWVLSGVDVELPIAKDLSGEIASDLSAYLRETDDAKAREREKKLAQFPVSQLVEAFRSLKPPGVASVGRQPDKSLDIGGEGAKYSLFVPKDYSPLKPYPVMICLHGTGFDGVNYLDRWIPRLGSHYILACPTVSMGEWWSPEAERLVLALIRELLLTYRVDTNRIFLSGMSSGGVGTYLIGLNHADLFAGIIPVAGALPKSLFPLLDNLETTPLYLIHGSKDGMMPPHLSRAVSEYMKGHGLSFVYREHDREHPQAGGHFFPEEEVPALLQWMEKQDRNPRSLKVAAVHDRDHLGRQDWIRLQEVEGVASFWASYQNRSEGEGLKAGRYARMRAELKGKNRFAITTERVRRFELLVSAQQVDFEKPVVVVVNGTVRFEGVVQPDAAVFLEEARHWPDPERAVWAVIPIRLDGI